MAGIKIADLYAQIGVKVDSSKLQTFLVKLSAVKMRVNQLSAALNKANSSMTNSYGVQAAAERLKAAQQRTITAQYNAQAAASRAAAAAARAANVSSRGATPRQQTRAKVSMGTGGMSASGLLAAPAGIVASLGGVYALTSSFVAVNKQMDSFKAGMLLSSDSAAEAAGQVEWLKNKAKEFGAEFRGATQDFTQFSATTSAMGATSSQTRVMYTDIMKIQTALAMTPDQAEGMTRALTQMVSKGKVMSEELKGQLAERVPGAVAIMAKAMGKTIPELFQMMKDGALDASVAVPKFLETYAKLTDTTGAFKQQQNSLAAAINKLKNSWFFLMEALGESGLKDLLKVSLDWLSEKIDYLTLHLDEIKLLFIDIYDNAAKLARGIMAVAPAVIAAGLGMAFFAAASWVANGGLTAMVGTNIVRLIVFFQSLAASTAAASGAFWSLILPMVLFGAVAAAAYLVWQDLTSSDSWFLDQANSANLLWQAVNNIYRSFTMLFEKVDELRSMTMPEWFMYIAKNAGMLTPQGMIGTAAGGIANLLPSQFASASANTTNSGGNVTIGTIVAQPGQTPAGIAGEFRGNGMQKSYSNAAVN